MFAFINVIILVALSGLRSSCCHGSSVGAGQRQPSTTTASARGRRRKRKLSKWKDGPSSTEIDCSLSPSVDYEYYIERCFDEITQWWINGRCVGGVKEEASELHRCWRPSDQSRPYCHDCVVGGGSGVVKHICGSNTYDGEEACGIALAATGKECGEHRLKAYSHQCFVQSDKSGPSTSSWYLRESFYCDEGEVYKTGPNEFTCGQEWYYAFDEDEHESGEEHPFSSEENRYCLDCGSAIQVCVGDGDATCESLGLSPPGRGGVAGGPANDAPKEVAGNGVQGSDEQSKSAEKEEVAKNEVQLSIEDGSGAEKEEVDGPSSTKVMEETNNIQAAANESTDAQDDVAKSDDADTSPSDNDDERENVEEENEGMEEGAGELNPINTVTEANGARESALEGDRQTDAEASNRYPDGRRHAWETHGLAGATTFGLLVPATIFVSARDPKYHRWIEWIGGCMGTFTFSMTFLVVGTAISAMNGMGEAGEGHLRETHHVVGLLLLLLMSFQTAGLFLRSPTQTAQRSFSIDDDDDDEQQHGDGADSKGEGRCSKAPPLIMWLLIFVLGTHQVRSGLGLFAERFGTPDWGQVYVAYTVWLVAAFLLGKLWTKWRERKMKEYLNRDNEVGGVKLSGDDGRVDDSSFAQVEEWQETAGLNW